MSFNNVSHMESLNLRIRIDAFFIFHFIVAIRFFLIQMASERIIIHENEKKNERVNACKCIQSPCPSSDNISLSSRFCSFLISLFPSSSSCHTPPSPVRSPFVLFFCLFSFNPSHGPINNITKYLQIHEQLSLAKLCRLFHQNVKFIEISEPVPLNKLFQRASVSAGAFKWFGTRKNSDNLTTNCLSSVPYASHPHLPSHLSCSFSHLLIDSLVSEFYLFRQTFYETFHSIKTIELTQEIKKSKQFIDYIRLFMNDTNIENWNENNDRNKFIRRAVNSSDNEKNSPWPNKLRHLIVHYWPSSDVCSIVINSLPSSLETLEFGLRSFNETWENQQQVHWPIALKSLIFRYSSTCSLSLINLPDSLTHLELSNHFNNLSHFYLPPNLRILKFTRYCPIHQGLAEHFTTHKCLETLILPDKFNQCLIGKLPLSLLHLWLGNEYTKPLEKLVNSNAKFKLLPSICHSALPPNLEILQFSENSQYSSPITRWPTKLRVLDWGGAQWVNRQTIPKENTQEDQASEAKWNERKEALHDQSDYCNHDLPPHLEELSFSPDAYFNAPLDDLLPNSLLKLVLPNSWNQPLVFPSSLKVVNFPIDSDFHQPIHTFPPSLQEIYFPLHYNLPVNFQRLPLSMKRIRFPTAMKNLTLAKARNIEVQE
jgi:hypothetical protein